MKICGKEVTLYCACGHIGGDEEWLDHHGTDSFLLDQVCHVDESIGVCPRCGMYPWFKPSEHGITKTDYDNRESTHD